VESLHRRTLPKENQADDREEIAVFTRRSHSGSSDRIGFTEYFRRKREENWDPAPVKSKGSQKRFKTSQMCGAHMLREFKRSAPIAIEGGGGNAVPKGHFKIRKPYTP